jgi:hypothetical protein
LACRITTIWMPSVLVVTAATVPASAAITRRAGGGADVDALVAAGCVGADDRALGGGTSWAEGAAVCCSPRFWGTGRGGRSLGGRGDLLLGKGAAALGGTGVGLPVPGGVTAEAGVAAPAGGIRRNCPSRTPRLAARPFHSATVPTGTP